MAEKKKKKPRSAAQKAATARLVAMQKARREGGEVSTKKGKGAKGARPLASLVAKLSGQVLSLSGRVGRVEKRVDGLEVNMAKVVGMMRQRFGG